MSTETVTMLAQDLSDLMENLADEIEASAILTNKDEVLTAFDTAFRKNQLLIDAAQKAEAQL